MHNSQVETHDEFTSQKLVPQHYNTFQERIDSTIQLAQKLTGLLEAHEIKLAEDIGANRVPYIRIYELRRVQRTLVTISFKIDSLVAIRDCVFNLISGEKVDYGQRWVFNDGCWAVKLKPVELYDKDIEYVQVTRAYLDKCLVVSKISNARQEIDTFLAD